MYEKYHSVVCNSNNNYHRGQKENILCCSINSTYNILTPSQKFLQLSHDFYCRVSCLLMNNNSLSAYTLMY